MTDVLNDLILIRQSNTDLPIWPLLVATALAAAMILRRRRPD